MSGPSGGLRIAMVCFPTPGGSGIVATELGRELAGRGHTVHFVAGDRPFRLPADQANITFHRVEAPSYPLFPEPLHLLALANALATLAAAEPLDVIHVHYAVPHAASAILARQALAASGRRRLPAVVTTVHGSDITLVGSHPGIAAMTAYSLRASHSVTAVSRFLREEARRRLAPDVPVEVVPNFVNPGRFRPRPDPELRRLFAADDQMLVIHVSNFRPVKRASEVVHIFSRVVRHVPARLLMVGDGPDQERAREEAEVLGVTDHVSFLGRQVDVAPLLGIADLFLMPSVSESFGLAAAEAMACGVPVIASEVGGLREVVRHGETGYLLAPEDVEAWTAACIHLLSDHDRRRCLGRAAAEDMRRRFAPDRVVPMYEAVYARAIRCAAHEDGRCAHPVVAPLQGDA